MNMNTNENLSLFKKVKNFGSIAVLYSHYISVSCIMSYLQAVYFDIQSCFLI